MSSQEIPVTLTPQQAAAGVILTVPVGTGTAQLRIPSARDGDLVRAWLGEDEVLLRVRVNWAAGAAQPAPGTRKGAGGCLAVLGVLAVVVIGILVLNDGDDGDNTASGTPTATPSSTYSGGSGPGPDPSGAASSWAPDPDPTPTPEDTATESDPSPSEAEPSPFDKGTCLNGTLPDSTTPQTVTGVEEVSCSASDAHYRVIESFPFTSDLDRCNDNPKTQYAFSYRYSRGATIINEYVYCLVGIGSYGR
ncbi:hypothetical protein ACFV0B_29615 [Streptomyces xanthophaeus]|uniref:LppU/SCO3897 family protein n=1 Tax=Streptomyces xanthophaeus TaxID=67385 RepID=UPI00369B2AFA